MDKNLSGTWEEFEAWVRSTNGSDFRWKIRPQDNPTNREMIADLIQGAMRRNNGIFPNNNTFIERMEG